MGSGTRLARENQQIKEFLMVKKFVGGFLVDKRVDAERLLAFTKDYLAICEKYGYIIDGCVYCGSPFLLDRRNKSKFAEYSYDVDEYRPWNRKEKE